MHSYAAAPAVYSLAVVLPRRGGIGLAAAVNAGVVASVWLAMGAAGCGGPLDSPEPRPRVYVDAGRDSGAGGSRPVRDGGIVPDAIVDTGIVPDAIVDAAVDVPWPVVPGCVSGLPPSPQFSPNTIPPVIISCAASSPIVLRVADAAAHGMLFDAKLDPPLDGFSLFSVGSVCTYDVDTPLQLYVAQGTAVPGLTFFTTLRITPVGPPPQPHYAFPLNITTVAIDFAVDPAVIDFGTVTAGQSLRMPLTVTNAVKSAAIDNLFPTAPQQGPFLLVPTGMGQSPLQPGDSQVMLDAVLNARTPGAFEYTFLVSPFFPGVPIDVGCGAIRTVTLRAQVIASGLPP